jgi:hypothetical protein
LIVNSEARKCINFENEKTVIIKKNSQFNFPYRNFFCIRSEKKRYSYSILKLKCLETYRYCIN